MCWPLLPDRLDTFLALCERERCPVAVVGEATEEAVLQVIDPLLDEQPVDMPLEVLLGNPPEPDHRYPPARLQRAADRSRCDRVCTS